MKVREGHLNLWPVRRQYVEFLVTSYILAIGLLALLKIAVFQEYMYIWLVGSVGLFAANVMLIKTRNSMLKKWVTRHDFDFMYDVQSKASSLYSVALLLLILITVAGTTPLLILQKETEFLYLILAFSLIGLAHRTVNVFWKIFSTGTFAMLCFQSFFQKCNEDLRGATRKHLATGLGTLENMIRRYGVRISKEKLMFAISVGLLSGKNPKEELDNFGSAICDPNRESLGKAIESARRLLGVTRDSMALGLQIPYPLWRRLPTSRMWETTGNIIYLAAILIPIVLLYLLGVHQP